jgi:hypothetical protein
MKANLSRRITGIRIKYDIMNEIMQLKQSIKLPKDAP